ncbi:MAG: hypothetical protein PUC76_04325 [Clostridia bacterium]|nr:hypothetical protein [Clostridia bacterium]
MIDMAAAEQTCIVQVILRHEEFLNLRQHRRNETTLKKRILDFIRWLHQKGFRHFIVFINNAVDFWLAELLYFMESSDKKAALSYSLYLVPEDVEQISEWTMEEYYFDEVVRHAEKVHWCHGYWRMPGFPLMLLDMTDHSSFCEHCC